MKAAALVGLVFLASSTVMYGAVNESCKAGSQDRDLIRVHGRLTVYNGGYPNLRLWHIGTRHLFGIYSDPHDLECQRSADCGDVDEEDTKLPTSLEKMNLLDHFVYGDFVIRVLEPFKPGSMQAACIVDAQHLVYQR